MKKRKRLAKVIRKTKRKKKQSRKKDRPLRYTGWIGLYIGPMG